MNFEQAIADRLDQVHSDLADLTGRVAENERRQANKEIHGPVTNVDAEAQTARIRIGGTDDEPMLSPWVPYGVDAGDFKSVIHPSVGQNMTLSAPAGELRQGTLKPMAFSDANPSPSTDKDTHVILDFNGARISVDKTALTIKKGNNSIVLKDDSIVTAVGDNSVVTQKAALISIKVNGTEVELTPDALNAVASAIFGVGLMHLGVSAKNEAAPLKVETEGGPSPRVKAIV